MAHEIISCPLSACFIGMSHAQSLAAQSLRFSDLVAPCFDRASARAAYEALREPDHTADGEPTFLDRMLRRVGTSPLARSGAEVAAATFVLSLRSAGVLHGTLELTHARDEDLHGHFEPETWLALLGALGDDAFERLDPERRLDLLGDAPGRRVHAARRFPNLALAENAVVYLPGELTRTIEGVPYDVGHTRGLLREVDAVIDAFGLVRTERGRVVEPDGARDDARRHAIAELLDLVSAAAHWADAHARVVAVSG